MTNNCTKTHPLTGKPLLPVGYRQNGAPIWPILGASEAPPEGGTPPAPPATDPPKGEPGGEGEKQLPQSKVNSIVAAETEKAKAKALEDVQKLLGVSPEEAAQIVKAHQEKADAEKSEATKAREAADAEKAEAVKDRELAKQEVFATRADRALIKAGATAEDEDLDRLRGMLKVGTDASADDIAKDVKDLAEKFPALFNGATPPVKKAPGSDPKRTPTPGKPNSDAYTRGMERAAAAKPAREYPTPPGVPA